jgi:hypothetical protein
VTPRKITTRLEQTVGSTGSPRSLRSAIELELAFHFGLPAIQASEISERLEQKIAKIIAARVATCEENGITPVLTVIGSNSDRVAGFCYVLPTDQAHVTAIKQQRVHAQAILSAMKELSFDDFEKFGARALLTCPLKTRPLEAGVLS